MTNEPLEELQFTEEEIDHGVHALAQLQIEQEGRSSVLAEHVRAVLRAVRAVPARCLNGGLAGHPAQVGTHVQGVGLNGTRLRGRVVQSYPVTTTIQTPGNGVEFVWTNTLSSWDPSTDELEQKRLAAEAELGMPVVFDERVPLGVAYVGPAAFLMDPALMADDDGMAVEEGR